MEQVKSRLDHWFKAFGEATARKKHVPLARLNKILSSASRDLQRGHVVADDVESWTPAQVRRMHTHKDIELDACIPTRMLSVKEIEYGVFLVLFLASHMRVLDRSAPGYKQRVISPSMRAFSWMRA